MALRNSTNADWWSERGVIRSKATLTFSDNTFINVYASDYLKSWKVTQDLSANSETPVFDFVSDRLEMTLYSLDNDFNPFAENSQYYGKFTLGVKIDLFVKLDYLGDGDELHWDKIGEFKIAEIDVSETGTEAYILAYDSGYDGVESSKQQILAPTREIETSEDIEAFFDDVFPTYTIFIQEGISELPKKLFPLEGKLETMNEFLAALNCFSRCSGNVITIRSFDNIQRCVLDKNNIVSLSPEQSLTRQYRDSVIKWHEIGSQPGTEIISLIADFAAPGEKKYNNITFDSYINKLEETVCTSSDGSDITNIDISNVYSNALTLKVNNSQAGEVDVKVNAEVISFNEITEGPLDNAEDIYELSNKYIQTESHARAIKAKVDKFIRTRNQYVGATIGFNPLLQLSWLTNCNHADYDVNMNAYIVSQTLEISDAAPTGRHTLKLLNREAVS